MTKRLEAQKWASSLFADIPDVIVGGDNMKFFRKKKKPFDLAIDKALEEMQSYTVDSDEYGKAVKNLVMLTEAQSKTKCSSVSGDTVFKTVVGTLVPTVSLLIFENRGCITSKVFSKLNFK